MTEQKGQTMKHIITIVMALALTACGQSFEREARVAAASIAKDPETVQFKDVQTCPANPDMVSGFMNGKNGFGAYVGFTRFYYDRGVVTIQEGNTPETGNIAYIRYLAKRCGDEA